MPRPLTPPADPLADLREPETAALPTAAVPVNDPPADEPAVLEAQPLDLLWHNDAATKIVTRWHADLDLRAMLHGGGACGCRYLATVALLEAVGAPTETITPEGDPDA